MHPDMPEHHIFRQTAKVRLAHMVKALEVLCDSKWSLWAVIALATGLRLANYLANFDMFGDEVSVASSILSRTYTELFRPLDYFQNAPVGFLMVVEFFSNALACTQMEYALRLYPLIAAVVSVPLFLLLARRVLSGRAVVLAMFLFATSRYLVGYSSELKQYSADVMVILGMLVMSLWMKSGKHTVFRLVIYAVIGALAIWFSQPAVFILAGIGIYWSVEALTKRCFAEFARLFGVFVFWAVNFAVYYFAVASKYVTNEGYLTYFAHAFMPWPPKSYSDLCWFPNLLLRCLEAPGGFRPQVVLVVCLILVAGYITIYKSQRTAFFFLLSFLPLVLVASGLRLFPLQHRVVLFAVPIMILGVAQGAVYLAGRLAGPTPYVAATVVLIVAVPSFLDIRKFPFKPFRAEGIKASIAYFGEKRQPGDTLFLFRSADRTFRFYGPRYGMTYGMAGIEFIDGTLEVSDVGDLADDIEKLRGRRRVWLLLHNKLKTDMINERAFFLYYLDRIGRRLDEFEAECASIYLYDLTESKKEIDPTTDSAGNIPRFGETLIPVDTYEAI